MTDRIKGLVVTLDRDYRADNVEAIVNAILMVKGVAKVDQNVADASDHINRARIRDEMAARLWAALEQPQTSPLNLDIPTERTH